MLSAITSYTKIMYWDIYQLIAKPWYSLQEMNWSEQNERKQISSCLNLCRIQISKCQSTFCSMFQFGYPGVPSLSFSREKAKIGTAMSFWKYLFWVPEMWKKMSASFVEAYHFCGKTWKKIRKQSQSENNFLPRKRIETPLKSYWNVKAVMKCYP